MELVDSVGTGYAQLTETENKAIERTIREADVLVVVLNSKQLSSNQDVNFINAFKELRQEVFKDNFRRVLFVVNMYTSEALKENPDSTEAQLYQEYRNKAISFLKKIFPNSQREQPPAISERNVLVVDFQYALLSRLAEQRFVPPGFERVMIVPCFGENSIETIGEKKCQELWTKKGKISQITAFEQVLRDMAREGGELLKTSIQEEFAKHWGLLQDQLTSRLEVVRQDIKEGEALLGELTRGREIFEERRSLVFSPDFERKLGRTPRTWSSFSPSNTNICSSTPTRTLIELGTSGLVNQASNHLLRLETEFKLWKTNKATDVSKMHDDIVEGHRHPFFQSGSDSTLLSVITPFSLLVVPPTPPILSSIPISEHSYEHSSESCRRNIWGKKKCHTNRHTTQSYNCHDGDVQQVIGAVDNYKTQLEALAETVDSDSRAHFVDGLRASYNKVPGETVEAQITEIRKVLIANKQLEAKLLTLAKELKNAITTKPAREEL